MYQSPLFQKRAILIGTNSDVKELNESLLHQVPGETQTYLSIDSAWILMMLLMWEQKF